MLVGGSLGDHYGRRRAFLIGLVVFAGASAFCGLARSAQQLIIAREVQGIGSALLTPGSLAIIGASFSGTERGKAIGTWSSVTAITAAIGPGLGGWLAEHASWRWVFFINIPIAIAVLAIAFAHVPESRDDEQVHHIDWLGALLCTGGLGGLVYGLTFAAKLGWAAPSVVATLTFGVAALALFVSVESRARSPLMPLSIYASRTFSGANVLTLLLYGALTATMFFLPFDMIQIHGYTPTAAGLSFLPFIALIFLLSRMTGGLAQRFGARLPLMIGPAIAAAGLALMAVPGTGGSYWSTFFPAILVLGIGMSLVVAPLSTAVMSSVDANHMGVASGVNNAISRVASMLAIAVVGLFVVASFSRGLQSRLDALHPPPAVYAAVWEDRFALAATSAPAGVGKQLSDGVHAAVADAYVSAFRLAALACAALALAGGVAAAFTIERAPP
jgi:EmrB/QacA subfamily drug resistance transporter